jgi:anti-anti-sigma regulatory factor
MEMPEQLEAVQVQEFMRDMQPLLEDEQPRIVFDCSKVRDLDRVGVDMILHCAEVALNLDGDLKLAGMSPEAKAVLELMGGTGMLQAFATSADAVRSFQTGERMGKKAASVNLYSSESLKKAS